MLAFIVFYKFSMSVVLCLLAKGWGVVRLHLAPVEKRTIFGLCLFYALAEIFYYNIGDEAIVSVIF
jgi:hypothetical protein